MATATPVFLCPLISSTSSSTPVLQLHQTSVQNVYSTSSECSTDDSRVVCRVSRSVRQRPHVQVRPGLCPLHQDCVWLERVGEDGEDHRHSLTQVDQQVRHRLQVRGAADAEVRCL